MAKTNHSQGFKSRLGEITKIKSQNGEPVKMEAGQTIINKKATEKNLQRLVEINKDSSKKTSAKETNDGTVGGLLEGRAHYDKDGKPLGGIKVIVDNNKEIEVEGKEFVINEEASKKHWAELSKINQSAGNGVPINPPNDFDEDPEEFKEGGRVIDFNPNRVPSKMILNYAKKIKKNYPAVWDLGGNIFGNEAFENLKRVSERGYWLDSEEWMYIKWRSYVARHIHDFRIEGVIAMLKWVDRVEKGWPYMKNLIEAEIEKRKDKMSNGGSITYKNKYNKKYGYSKNESHNLKEISKDTGVSYKGLQQIYNKGIGAFKTNPESVRPNVKSKEQWAKARVYSAVMGGKAAKIDANELKMQKGGVSLNDCIYFIKNSEAIKNNGYYLEFKNLSIYIGSGDKVIPNIKSIFLITYNSGGQKNLKPIDTINSMELANKLANLLNVEIGVARIIVSEQLTHSKRFEINKINSIVNKNIIIADRNTIVCTNLPMKLSNGTNTTFDQDNLDIQFDEGGDIKKPTFRIIKSDGRIKYAGTDKPSWLTLKMAKKLVNYSDGEMIYEFDKNGNPVWEIFKNGGSLESNFELENTEKLISELKKYSTKTTSDVMTNAEGHSYVFHTWKLTYPHASNWLVRLFEKAAYENTGKTYLSQFSSGDILFTYERPEFKGRPNGSMRMKMLNVLNNFKKIKK